MDPIPSFPYALPREDDDTSGYLPEPVGLSWPDADVFGRAADLGGECDGELGDEWIGAAP